MARPERFTVQQVEEALQACDGVMKRAAAKLGCDPTHLSRFARNHPEIDTCRRYPRGSPRTYATQITDDEIVEVLRRHHGVIAVAARAAGFASPDALVGRIRRNRELQQVLSEARATDLPPWNVPISRVRIWDTQGG